MVMQSVAVVEFGIKNGPWRDDGDGCFEIKVMADVTFTDMRLAGF